MALVFGKNKEIEELKKRISELEKKKSEATIKLKLENSSTSGIEEKIRSLKQELSRIEDLHSIEAAKPNEAVIKLELNSGSNNKGSTKANAGQKKKPKKNLKKASEKSSKKASEKSKSSKAQKLSKKKEALKKENKAGQKSKAGAKSKNTTKKKAARGKGAGKQEAKKQLTKKKAQKTNAKAASGKKKRAKKASSRKSKASKQSKAVEKKLQDFEVIKESIEELKKRVIRLENSKARLRPAPGFKKTLEMLNTNIEKLISAVSAIEISESFESAEPVFDELKLKIARIEEQNTKIAEALVAVAETVSSIAEKASAGSFIEQGTEEVYAKKGKKAVSKQAYSESRKPDYSSALPGYKAGSGEKGRLPSLSHNDIHRIFSKHRWQHQNTGQEASDKLDFKLEKLPLKSFGKDSGASKNESGIDESSKEDDASLSGEEKKIKPIEPGFMPPPPL